MMWASQLYGKIKNKVISFNLGSAHGWVGRHEQCTKECTEDEWETKTDQEQEGRQKTVLPKGI